MALAKNDGAERNYLADEGFGRISATVYDRSYRCDWQAADLPIMLDLSCFRLAHRSRLVIKRQGDQCDLKNPF